MEDLVKRFGDSRSSLTTKEKSRANLFHKERIELQQNNQRFKNITPALFFDRCPEVIYGFETLVTLVPTVNRSSHLIGLLTVNQKETSEGFRSHIDSLFRILVTGKAVNELTNLPLLAVNTKGQLLEEAMDIGANVILEQYGETFSRLYPRKATQQLLHMIKEKMLRPIIVPYQELLHLNIYEVEAKLGNESDLLSTKLNGTKQRTDPSYFHSLMDLLQSSSCSPTEFRRIHLFFTNPNTEDSIQEFWKVWSHEQIAAKVFPVSSNKTKIGSHHFFTSHGGICFNQQTNIPQFLETNFTNIQGQHASEIHGSIMTRVPVKEGLSSVIKCLKNQDTSTITTGEEICSGLLPNENKTEHTKTTKICQYNNSTYGKHPQKGTLKGLNTIAMGLSRYNSKMTGLQSAFHPPMSSYLNHHLSGTHPSFNLIKPITTYPSRQGYYYNKFFEEGISPFNGRGEVSEMNQRHLPPAMSTFPFILGCYSSIKTCPLTTVPRPVISMNGTPILYCHWKPFECGIDKN